MAIEQLNETTFLIEFAEHKGDPPLLQVSNTYQQILSELKKDDLISLVPASHSLLVEFDPAATSAVTVRQTLELITAQQNSVLNKLTMTGAEPRSYKIPVYYHPSVAPDLNTVATQTGHSVDQLIALHCSVKYQVLAVGFLPGFAYMGSLPKRLELPRMATPRLKVPGGSVAIAEAYTGIYPRQTPGGWHVIGRTPLAMLSPLDNSEFDDSPSLLKVADQVSFHAITQQEYLDAGGELAD